MKIYHQTPIFLLLTFLTLVLMLLNFIVKPKKSFAQINNIYPYVCNVHMTFNENPYCPSGQAGIGNYSYSVTFSSIDGYTHSVNYTTANSFCTSGGGGPCTQNSIPGGGTQNTPFTVTMSRSPTIGNNCGTYQDDVWINSVDGNGGCQWGNRGNPGGAGYCSTNVQCGYQSFGTCAGLPPNESMCTNAPCGQDIATNYPQTIYSNCPSCACKYNCCGNPPPCTQGSINCGPCNAPNNTCNNNNGTQTCYHNGPGYCTNQPFQQACTINRCVGQNLCINQKCVPPCTTGGGCQACVPNQPNTCNNNNGTQQCNYTAPQTCYTVNYSKACTIDACYANQGYACTGGKCTTSISGKVFIDFNDNGQVDNGDTPEVGYTVHIQGNGVNTNAQTNGSGDFTFPGLTSGNYTVSVNVPPNYIISSGTQASRNFTLGPQITNVLFGFAPLYSISGLIYVDLDNNILFNQPPDITMPQGGNTIQITGPNKSVTLNNVLSNYTSNQVLPAGQYTITYQNPPTTKYLIEYPRNGPQPTFQVTVGIQNKNPACNPQGYTANCDAQGNIINANFALKFGNPFMQNFCGDWRSDAGITNKMPNAGTCGGVSNSNANETSAICTKGGNFPGVFFAGDKPTDFTPGNVSSTNWLVGGTSYPETFTPVHPGVVRTSYSYMLTTAQQSGITPIDLSGKDQNNTFYCQNGGSINPCTLEPNLPNGIYTAHGNISLNAYNFTNNQNYVFLIDGNLTINGNILVSDGSTAIFSVGSTNSNVNKGDIYVNATVGEITATSQDANIQGLYSADNNFIVLTNTTANNVCQPNGNPLDLRLNIYGAIVTNAALMQPTAGVFDNRRNLCNQNLNCPAVALSVDKGNQSGGRNGAGTGITYLLNAPTFIKHKSFVWQEVAP